AHREGLSSDPKVGVPQAATSEVPGSDRQRRRSLWRAEGVMIRAVLIIRSASGSVPPRPAPQRIVLATRCRADRIDAVAPALGEMRRQSAGRPQSRDDQRPVTDEASQAESDPHHETPLEDSPPRGSLHLEDGEECGPENDHRKEY